MDCPTKWQSTKIQKVQKYKKNSPVPAISTKKQNRVKQKKYKTEKYKNLKNTKYANRCKKS